jgi:hypothetical protein
MGSFVTYILLQNMIRLKKSRRVRCTGHVACMWKKRNAYRFLLGTLEGNGSLGRLRTRRKDNEIGLREIGWISMDRINMTEDRNQWRDILNAVMNLF